MITNVPTEKDFLDHGLMFLNLAWDSVFSLLLEHRNVEQSYCDEEQAATYWQAARSPLSVAHALAQQGAELALKSQVAGVSPYLLLASQPADWPKIGTRGEVAYADFRTIDTQDLLKACNTVRSDPLPDAFVGTFTKFRKQRNALFHTVDARLEFSDKEIVRYILQVVQIVLPKQWPKIRKRHIEEQPIFKAYAVDDAMNEYVAEMSYVIDLLKPTDLREFFGFEKRQRRYICPQCYWDLNRDYDPDKPLTAQLRPNTPQSTKVYCFVCDRETEVVRKRCRNPECKGNVISTDHDRECLACFEDQAGDS